jgi:hypothetical protein
MNMHSTANRGFRISLVAALFAALSATTPATPARAQVLCGDVIVGLATMMADITGCAVNPTVTVDGGTLKMDGHSIIGSLGDGIRIIGNGGRVEEGRVTGSTGDGIVLAGAGGHRVENVNSEGNVGPGFRFLSSNNRIERTSSANNSMGWRMEPGADNNTVSNSAAHNNASAAIVDSNRNDFRDSAVSRHPTGFQVNGNRNQLRDFALSRTSVFVTGNRNKLKYLHSMGDGTSMFVGFDFSGNRNRLERSRLALHGIAVKAFGNLGRFSRLTIVDSLTIGIGIIGNANRIDRNLVTTSGFGGVGDTGIGVQAAAAINNRIERNTVVGHLVNDLADVDPLCMNNVWNNNIEKLKTPACIN